MNTLQKAIVDCNDVALDCIWSILKRQDKKFGILKKLKCIAYILDLDEDLVLDEAIVDEGGRFLDHPNRDMIHQALMARKG